MGAVAIGALLFAVLLVILAAVVWQEARSADRRVRPVYLLDEASRFVFERLPADPASRLDLADVEAILHWGLYHSQVVAGRDNGEAPVIGGDEAAAFVVRQATEAGGDPYRRDDVATVLGLETEYLMEIGAIGDAVEEDAQ